MTKNIRSIDVTTDMIAALRAEAAAAGDTATVRACDRALAGSARARAVCAKAINAARAMAD